MGYAKVISYSDIVEIYTYEKNPRPTGRKKRAVQSGVDIKDIPSSGEDVSYEIQPPKVRSKESARRAVLAFKRLVRANLDGYSYPVLASLTYAENMGDLGQARKDFNAFAKRLKSTFGQSLRYIAVAEFQRRGAVHFHTLLWGIPQGAVRTERHTRLVAGLWGRGFTDIAETDGSPKLAGYLAKYLSKTFADTRLLNKKAYITSQNIQRPIIDKNTLLSPYFYDIHKSTKLSTARLLHDKEFMTLWLGKGRCRIYKLIKSPHESSNNE